jgi:aminopeptidase N
MPKPFAPPGTPVRYLPDRPVSMEHVRLELDLDLAGRKLSGRSRLRLRVRRDDLPAVELHAVDMTIDEVKVDGGLPRSFRYDGQTLRIELPHRYERETGLELEIAYRCAPTRGLYFVGPDEVDPNRPWQCWTQGQDEDSRHYWPGLDIPVEKATSEIVCTAPKGLFVLSNGDLREHTELSGDRERWHYALDFPHAGYLVTLVCGPFVQVEDRAPETDVQVYYFVPAGREADARRSFGATPRMIDFFSRRIGVRYPHRRYSQVVVNDFIFGGMENTTATTLTSEALLDERAALDHDVEGLVAHELAHQWWGNLLTCREWPEAWLNEGFATYFEYVWREHAHGRDEADCELLNDTQAYLGEAGKYQRPVVCRQYNEPIELFDSHLYDKGGRVLHMLRHTLGDDVFWRALHLYAERHAHRSVETRDLARAVEDASGRNLDPFFDQWIGNPGHPELEGSWRWDDETALGRLRLEQKQGGDRVYSFDVKVVFEIDGAFSEQTLMVRERSQTFELPLKGRPDQVVFDPGDVILKTIKLDKPRPLWLRQLQRAALAVDRVGAARALAELPGPETVAALREALADDPFWAVRAAAARALGQIRGSDAREALVAFQGDDHLKVRRAVAAALGELRDDPEAAAVLARWASEGDPSCFVEGAAALSLGRVRGAQALAVLPKLLERDSFQDVVRARALEGLGATSDERALPILEAAYAGRARFQTRRAAVAAVARLTEGTVQSRRGRELMERALDDRDFRVRMEAASGLVTLQDGRAIPALERAARVELDGRARRRIREAIAELTEKGRPAEQARKVSEELERVRKELDDMRGRLEKLELRSTESPAANGGTRKRGEAATGRRPRPRTRRGLKRPRRGSR